MNAPQGYPPCFFFTFKNKGMIFNKLNLHDTLAFIFGVSIGIFLLYIYKPAPVVIMKHPTPDNVDNTIYKNKDRSCYKYTANEVACNGLVLDHPIIISG